MTNKALHIILFCILSVYCYAQQWQIEEQPADELRGTPKIVYFTCYYDSDNHYNYFKCTKGEWDSFTIYTLNLFDSELVESYSAGYLFGFDRYCIVKIGLYDSNSKLIKAYTNVGLLVSDKNERIASLKNNEIAREVLYHLFNTNGYARILMPAAFSDKDIEIKIPYFPYSKRKG